MSKIEFIDVSDGKGSVNYQVNANCENNLDNGKFNSNNVQTLLSMAPEKYRWTRHSNMAFINKCKKYREAFETNCVRHEIFTRIGQELKNEGIHIEPQKIKWKWDNLRRQYHKKKRYPDSEFNFEYYNDMEEILTPKPRNHATKSQLPFINDTNVNTKNTLTNYDMETHSAFENENYEHDSYMEDYLENDTSPGNDKVETSEWLNDLNTKIWSKRTILSLIRKYKEHRKELTSKQFGRDAVFKKISDELKNEGIHIDPLKLKCKWSDLKNKYFKKKNTPSEVRYDWQFYDKFHEIYGDKKNVQLINQSIPLSKNYNDTNINIKYSTGSNIDDDQKIWSSYEILSLISKYKEHQKEIESNKLRKDLVYKKISDELKLNGVNIDSVKIHLKWQSLKKQYYEKKMGLAAFDFYDEFDEIYGSNKSAESVKPESSKIDEYNDININKSTFFSDDDESESHFFAEKNHAYENAFQDYLENSNLESPLTQAVGPSENYEYNATMPRNKMKWSRELILSLIRKCKEHKEELNSNTVRIDDLFKKISDELKSEGINVDQDRFRRKWSHLKKLYFKAKCDNSQDSFDFFKEMNDFYNGSVNNNEGKVNNNYASNLPSTNYDSRGDKKRLGEKLLECLTELRREKHKRHEELMAVVIDGQNKILNAIKQRDDEFKEIMNTILGRL